ncbi:hypothetical protein [Agromyces aureus]|uniref:Uncharacterized protein n=1 Tax=Agromyces aureus TaxID=453304 RepID=A0A191WEK0_9MICO|nr:hypothetical protein [Agromyces aureus]ANJ26652.1 hypothetical protein ATC03_07945 [Agromyces aureus]
MNKIKGTDANASGIGAHTDLTAVVVEALDLQARARQSEAETIRQLEREGKTVVVLPNQWAHSESGLFYIVDHFKGDVISETEPWAVERANNQNAGYAVWRNGDPQGKSWRDDMDHDRHRVRHGIWRLIAEVVMGSVADTFPKPFRYVVLELVG